MSKLIIDNCSTVSDECALVLVGRVIAGGKVSVTAGKKHYCHHSTFTVEEDGMKRMVGVHSHPNYKSSKFTIYNELGL